MNRYDDQWPDVIDAEAWAAIRGMSEAGARAYRLAAFFGRAREVRG